MLGKPNIDRISERREGAKRQILDAAWEVCREEGVAGLSIREVARRVGMKAPSLYEYFDSKHAIYDAMFAEGYRTFREKFSDEHGALTREPRAALKRRAREFVAFCAADPARYQLMFQRTIPGFEPSREAYAESVEAYEEMRAAFASIGVDGQRVLDLWTALTTGLAAQQIANDPGGDRWLRLADEAVDMFLHQVLPKGQGGRARK